MSLLEVLIAMFVITIGMLSVAALIPTGHFAVIESTKSDRGAACGRAALSEVTTRNMPRCTNYTASAFVSDPNTTMLDESTWCWPMGVYAGLYSPLRYAAQYGDAFVIDPLGIASNAGIDAMWAFPYDVNETVPTWGSFFLGRVTYARALDTIVPPPATPPAPLLPLTVAERVFTFGDDVIFDVERSEPDRRARASVLWNTGRVGPYPDPTATDFPLRQQNAGHYTWMLTVSPAASQIGGTSFRKYTVSAVVSHRRNTAHLPIDPSSPPDAENMPPERLAYVRIDGGGYGGGDMTLYLPPSHSSGTMFDGDGFGFTSHAQYEAYLNVKPGNWIMLMGFKRDPRVVPGYRRVARWYRVVSVDDVPTTTDAFDGVDAYYRRVTLDGPDWTDVLVGLTRAILMDDVIGVYTKTIEVGE